MHENLDFDTSSLFDIVTVKVGSTSEPRQVAGAIAGMIREGRRVEAQAIGQTACYVMIQAAALATSFLEETHKIYVAVSSTVITDDRTGYGYITVGYKFEFKVVELIHAEYDWGRRRWVKKDNYTVKSSSKAG